MNRTALPRVLFRFVAWNEVPYQFRAAGYRGVIKEKKLITYNELNLDENDSRITFSGTYGSGVKINNEFEDGDSVTLKKGDIEIEVLDAKKQEDGKYKGIIKYVKPYKSLEKAGADEGVEIIFKYKNIFECSHFN